LKIVDNSKLEMKTRKEEKEMTVLLLTNTKAIAYSALFARQSD
jgi:hypothetical protein